jgi:RNA polymerase sigma-70 factor (ECF subfamily)
MRTDDDLIAAFRAGEREAFDEIFERYRGPIWTFFRRRTPDSGRAEELAQETFLAVLEGSSRYEPRGAFRSYLFGIAFNQLKASRRRLARVPASIEPDDLPRRDADPADAIWVRRALESLDPDDREIVMLREYDALSYQEIAALLKLPLNTVRSRLFRARLALKAQLEGAPQGVLR